MKKFKNHSYAFTLIEIIVAITILSIILVSVMQIYISTTDINLKTDITRALQQNIKSSIELLSEDIRSTNTLIKVASDSIDTDCSLNPSGNETKSGMRLCLGGNKYNLAQLDIFGNYVLVEKAQCSDIEEHCTLVRNNKPIMNSWVDVKNLEFKISNNGVKKVTILMTLQPAIGKGIKPNLIKANRLHFQTTISERPNLN